MVGFQKLGIEQSKIINQLHNSNSARIFERVPPKLIS